MRESGPGDMPFVLATSWNTLKTMSFVIAIVFPAATFV